MEENKPRTWKELFKGRPQPDHVLIELHAIRELLEEIVEMLKEE